MSDADSTIRPVPGPRWTRKRLIGMLIDCYGPTPRGAVNVAAVADYAGVSSSTVRRWIAGGQPQDRRRRKPAIPKHRVTQLQRGPEVVERRNQQQYQYALDGLGSLGDDQAILPAWRQQGWLKEHTVAVVGLYGKPWHQVAVTNANRRAMAELLRRGTLLDSLTVPTRFHAQILAHAVMTRQQNWRVHPTPQQLKQGRTNVWMADAPAVDLATLAALVPRHDQAGDTCEGLSVDSTGMANSFTGFRGPGRQSARR